MGNAYCKIPLLAYFLFSCSRIYSGSVLGNVSLLSSNWSSLSSSAARTFCSVWHLCVSTTCRRTGRFQTRHLLLLCSTCKGCSAHDLQWNDIFYPRCFISSHHRQTPPAWTKSLLRGSAEKPLSHLILSTNAETCNKLFWKVYGLYS